jgi:hypothetical protein
LFTQAINPLPVADHTADEFTGQAVERPIKSLALGVILAPACVGIGSVLGNHISLGEFSLRCLARKIDMIERNLIQIQIRALVLPYLNRLREHLDAIRAGTDRALP